MGIAEILIVLALIFLVLAAVPRITWPLWPSVLCLILEGVVRVFGK